MATLHRAKVAPRITPLLLVIVEVVGKCPQSTVNIEGATPFHWVQFVSHE